MSLKKIEVNVAAQFDDVMVLLKNLCIVIREKGDYARLLGDVIAAVQGADQIPAEASALPMSLVRSAALRGIDVAEVFLAPSPNAPATPPGGGGLGAEVANEVLGAPV